MERDIKRVGSARHTIILCGILFGIALSGWLALRSTAAVPIAPSPSGPALYLGVVAAELGLLYYVWIGVRRRSGLGDLISSRTLTPANIAIDFAVGLALLAILLAIEWALAAIAGGDDTRLVRQVVADAARQPLLWILLSIVAGVSEELTFRGYLQRQLLAWSHSPIFAIIAQAALFGVSHGYQGGILVVKITTLGIVLGIAALLRRSCVPGIVAHVGLDIIGGLAG